MSSNQVRQVILTIKEPLPIGHIHTKVSCRLEELELSDTTPIEFNREGPYTIVVAVITGSKEDPDRWCGAW